jgi:hypothetical protein
MVVLLKNCNGGLWDAAVQRVFYGLRLLVEFYVRFVCVECHVQVVPCADVAVLDIVLLFVDGACP